MATRAAAKRTGQGERSRVPAIDAGVRVLRHLAGRAEGAGVSEISRECGLSKSTAHGIVKESLILEKAESSRGVRVTVSVGERFPPDRRGRCQRRQREVILSQPPLVAAAGARYPDASDAWQKHPRSTGRRQE